MTATIVNTTGLKGTDNDRNIDWAYQNKLRQQWLENNPHAVYIGWTSI
jgi:hypothetical protein